MTEQTKNKEKHQKTETSYGKYEYENYVQTWEVQESKHSEVSRIGTSTWRK